MSRYIDADELIFIGLDNPDDDHLFEFVPKEFIDNAPTADVREVVHGKWELLGEHDLYLIKCSACGFKELEEYNYCPNCGADMRGGKDAEL